MLTKTRRYLELQIWMGVFYAGAIASAFFGVFIYLNSLQYQDERTLAAFWLAIGCGVASLVLSFLGAVIRMAVDVAGDLKFLRDAAEADLEAEQFRALLTATPAPPPVVKR